MNKQSIAVNIYMSCVYIYHLAKTVAIDVEHALIAVMRCGHYAPFIGIDDKGGGGGKERRMRG
jgi:hypothetical protein